VISQPTSRIGLILNSPRGWLSVVIREVQFTFNLPGQTANNKKMLEFTVQKAKKNYIKRTIQAI